MKNRRQFDLVVFGADPSGLAAAACAARAGAHVGVIAAAVAPPVDGAAASVPNFVWRRLDLHEANLTLEPVTAQVSIFEGGRAVATYESDLKSEEELAKLDKADAALWRDFRAELSHRHAAGRRAPAEALAIGDEPAPHLMTDLQATDSLVDLVEDYFETQDVRTHLTAVAGLAFGLGGEEPGSALALASTAAQAAWKVRNGAELAAALDEVATRAGVVRLPNSIVRVDVKEGRGIAIQFAADEVATTNALMASSVRVARTAGFRVAGAPSALDAGDAAEARIRLRLRETPKPPTAIGGEAPLYYIAESPEEIRAARDAVLEGRTPETPPLMFEIADKEIHVRAPYCPRVLTTEEGVREWTGQDRQVLGAQVLKRLGKYLNGALKTVEETDVTLYGVVDAEAGIRVNEDAPAIEAPAPALDEIGAAASLALRLVGRE